jgi:hypothetical protein
MGRNRNRLTMSKARAATYVIAQSVILLLLVAPAYANRGPGALPGSGPLSGSWLIEYFTVSSGSCTATAWSAYAMDGQGIGGGSGLSPLVGSGVSICIKLSVSGSSDDGKKVWSEIDGGNSPYPGPVYLFTISGGSGSGTYIWTNNLSEAFRLNFCTVPVKVALGDSATTAPSSNAFDGHNADHLLAGSQPGTVCAPAGVPETPLSGPLLVASALPLVFLARRTIRT